LPTLVNEFSYGINFIDQIVWVWLFWNDA